MPGKLETIIGQGTRINGTVAVEGTIRVDGCLEGDLQTTGDVIVGENGYIKANIQAQNVTVAGTVAGNIEAIESLNLLATGRIQGDICVGSLAICQGGILRGQCEMTGADMAETE